MIVETATVWTFSALVISFTVVAVYFLIFFGIFYVVGWVIAQVVRPVLTLLNYE